MVTRGRLAGGLYGLLIGDALGVPYEFHARENIPAKPLIEMQPPPGFARAHRGTPPGTWSDDGAQALCLLTSLLNREQLDESDFAERLLAWYEHGALAVDQRVFDVGVQTQLALRALMQGTPPLQAGPKEERHNGNGSLMRVLPLALWHKGSSSELVEDAYRQSCVTHGHARSRVCCALYCLWARNELRGRANAWHEAVASLRAIIADRPEEVEALEFHIRPDDAPEGQGSGYVVDTLRSARMASLEPDYQSAVRAAIALGHDTDTTACVAGGIMGIRHGFAGIPARWREMLRGREMVEPLLAGLLAHHTL